MAFTAKTACSHYIDALGDLGVFLAANGWTERYSSAPPTGGWSGALTAGEIGYKSFEGPGVDSSQRVYIHIQTSDVGGKFVWLLYGSTAYSAGSAQTPWTQPGAMGGVYLSLRDTSIDHIFYANDRRFIVVAKMGASYNSMYAGFFMPFALPDEYSFPLYVAGTSAIPRSYNDANNGHSGFADPGAGSAKVRCYDGTVRDVDNRVTDQALNFRTSGERVVVWPRGVSRNSITPASASSNYWGECGFQNMVLNENEESPLFQAHLIDGVAGHVLGGLDGVYHVTGEGRSAEQVTSNGGRDFMLFTNAGHAGDGDFFAVEEV